MEQQPTFIGYLESVDDAATLANACLLGTLPSIKSRYKAPVKSGDCFVFIEQKSNVKRWTDGKMWSPSRHLGNFLVYRELENIETGGKSVSRVKENGLYKKTVSVQVRGWKCHCVCYYQDTHVCDTPSRNPHIPPLLDGFSLVSNSTTPGTSKTTPIKRSTGAKRKRSPIHDQEDCNDECYQLTEFPNDYFIIN